MIQIIIIVAYFLVTILIGVLSKRSTKNAAGYEGFKLSLLMCVAVGAGEWMGGSSTTGVSEYGYDFGISGAWYTIANGIGIAFLAVFFAKLFRSLNTSTVPEIIGRYLGKKSRTVSSVLLTFVLMIVGVSQMIAIGTLGQKLFNLNPALSIIILGAGVLIYTCAGGIKAIGSTNVMHLVVMYVGVVLALLLCAKNIGSVGVLAEKLNALGDGKDYFSPIEIGPNKVISWIIASVLGACTAQAGLQPILKSKDEKTAVKSSALIALIVAPFGILTALLGMYAKAMFPNLESGKIALPTLLMEGGMPSAISGLVMAAILAAVLSTASPIFLSCGTLITRDLYCEYAKNKDTISDKKLLTISRLATLFAGAVCITLAVLLRSMRVLDIVYFAYSIRGSLFVVLLLGIFWKYMNQKSAIASMSCTAIVGIFWVVYNKVNGAYPIKGVTETYAAVATALIVGVVVGVLTKKNEKSVKKGLPVRKTVVEYVSDWAQQTPDKPAVITADQTVTYSELYELVQGYAKFLVASGVKRGDIVVVRASQDVDYVVIYLAVHLAGGVVNSLENNIPDDSMIAVAEQINADVVITDNLSLKDEYDAVFIKRNGVLEYAKEHLKDDTVLSFPLLDDSADILFTTGTTGASKGVELSHKALVATAENLIFGCEYKKDTLLIAPGPLNHANAIRKLFTTMVNGSTIYILRGMTNVKAFFTALDYEGGIKACCLPPAAIRTIFQLTRDRLGDYKDKIDFIESATSPLPEPDKVKLCELLPNTRLYNNYGSSESASVCMYDYNKYKGKDGCIGKAMPNSQIIIVDDEKNEMQSSKEHMGLIACKGDVNMKGYVNEPALTREVLIDGVVYTNDIGYIDDEGFIYIAGRQGDVINVGGLKVAPNEVESVALGYEGIDDCICIAVEDKISGNALKLLVVMHDDAELDVKDLRTFLGKSLESYKIPTRYEKVDEVARTYNGKLNRKFYRQ